MIRILEIAKETGGVYFNISDLSPAEFYFLQRRCYSQPIFSQHMEFKCLQEMHLLVEIEYTEIGRWNFIMDLHTPIEDDYRFLGKEEIIEMRNIDGNI